MDTLQKKKILIIEDDRALQNAMGEVLANEGFEPVSAFDGQEGIEKAASVHPDLILLDIVLPKKDGYEVLGEIKKSPQKDVPVLIITNLEEIDNVQRALDLGATTFMVKSDFSLKDIVEKIRQNLSPRQLPAE